MLTYGGKGGMEESSLLLQPLFESRFVGRIHCLLN